MASRRYLRGAERHLAVAACALRPGTRITYLYPVDGIPGVPRNLSRDRNQGPDSERLVLKRRLFALGVRIWLLTLSGAEKATRNDYQRWQAGTGFLSSNNVDRFGQWSEIKREAEEENGRVRAEGGDPLADAWEQHAAVQAERDALIATASIADFSFPDALKAVLAGPHAEAVMPIQGKKPRATQ